MLQRLPAAALSKTGVFSASRAAPLRVIQRSSSVGLVLLHISELGCSRLTTGQVRVF
jgi:hypothetical protein